MEVNCAVVLWYCGSLVVRFTWRSWYISDANVCHISMEEVEVLRLGVEEGFPHKHTKHKFKPNINSKYQAPIPNPT